MVPLHASPLRLRGHHLICLHFFKGEGYRPDFVENLRKVLDRAKAGEQIEICEGPDDICRMCPFLEKDRCLYHEDAEEEIREMDRAATDLLRIRSGGNIAWPDIQERIPGIFTVWVRKFCGDCDWFTVCRRNKFFTFLFDEKDHREF
ncbi:MAG: DUF1284 domain-containing protein [Nitrospirota bacterium]